MSEIKRLLAANCSVNLMELLDVDPTAVDAIKISEFNRPEYIDIYQRAAADRPLILHCLGQNLAPGTADFAERLDRDLLVLALRTAKPSYLSMHLECVVKTGSTLTNTGPTGFLKRLERDIELVRRLSGLPIIMENSSLEWVRKDGSHNAQFVSDPAFITEALDATQTGLLLDLSHAQTTAWHRGEPALAYLRRLPLHLVGEIHISGPAMVDGELRDRHLEVQNEGYKLLAEVLPGTPAKVVSLEYGGFGPLFEDRSTPSGLAQQLARLRQIITSCRQS